MICFNIGKYNLNGVLLCKLKIYKLKNAALKGSIFFAVFIELGTVLKNQNNSFPLIPSPALPWQAPKSLPSQHRTIPLLYSRNIQSRFARHGSYTDSVPKFYAHSPAFLKAAEPLCLIIAYGKQYQYFNPYPYGYIGFPPPPFCSSEYTLPVFMGIWA
jgi:hypothetical protein